jgi:hypothetical protein
MGAIDWTRLGHGGAIVATTRRRSFWRWLLRYWLH